MDMTQATLQPPATIPVPVGLARKVFEATGVAVFFFGRDGHRVSETEPGAASGDEAMSAALAPLALQVASCGDDQVVADAGRVCAAWLIENRHRSELVAAASLPARTVEDRATARRLLAAAAEIIRADFGESAAQAEALASAEALLQSYEEISLLHHLGDGLRVTRSTAELLQQVCEELRDTIGAEATAAYLPGSAAEASELIIVGRLPFDVDALPQTIDHLLDGLGDEADRDLPDRLAGTTRASVVINNHCQNDPVLAGLSSALHRVVLVPLTVGDGRRGALLAFNCTEGEFGSPDAKLIHSTASASGIFIENRRLYRELQDMMLDLVRALVSSVDAKDPYTCGHSERVAITCRRLALQMGLPPDQVEQVYLTGLLHDIGKIGTPEHILRKEGRLEPEERTIMMRHSEIGARILAGVGKLGSIREAVLYHHERMDGTGYPSGLKGDQIPLTARIVGLADAFDAMTSNRPYRPMLPLTQVQAEIRRCMGTQFDEAVAGALLELDLHQLMREFAERPTTVCI
jgi:putative nucleotidyltransferase with HDIG domain